MPLCGFASSLPHQIFPLPYVRSVSPPGIFPSPHISRAMDAIFSSHSGKPASEGDLSGGLPITVAPASISDFIFARSSGVIVLKSGRTSILYEPPPGKTIEPSLTDAFSTRKIGEQPSKEKPRLSGITGLPSSAENGGRNT